MIPGLIKRILLTTAVLAVVVTLGISNHDWRAAIAFACAVAWAMANLLVWALGLRVLLMDQSPMKSTRLLRLGLVKVALLATGLLALRFTVPLTKNESLAIIAGIPLILFVAALKALGAKLTGRDLMTGQRLDHIPEATAGKTVTVAGGEA